MKFYDNITDENEYPKVVIQLPMFNEKAVAVRIIEAAAAVDYPRSNLEIQVLDDSTDDTVDYVDETVHKLKEDGCNITVIRREDRVGFKAGALKNGLESTGAEFVAIFDADFVPQKNFLKHSVPFFIGRPKIGLVQGRWVHLNQNVSLVTRAQAMGIDGHFMIEQAARSWNNLFMNFNGTAGIFRIEAINDSGGWQHDTLTEDMDLSYRLQLADWETEYVPELEVPAEIPEDINAFKSQQFRWAKGSIQTAIKIIPQIFNKKGISFFKQFQAVMHLTHYIVHPLILTMALLTMPILHFVKLQLPGPLFVALFVAIILAASGPSTMYMVSQHFIGNRKREKFFLMPALMVIGTGLAINNGKGVFEAILKRNSAFIRTPKNGDKGEIAYKPLVDKLFIVEVMVGLYCLASFHLFFGQTSLIISPFLILYASGFLFVGALSIFHRCIPKLIDKPVFKNH